MAARGSSSQETYPLEVTINQLRDIRRALKKLDNVTGPGVVNGVDFITINPPQARQPSAAQQNRHHPLKITSKFSSGSVGVYACDAFLAGDIEKGQNETIEEADLGTKTSAAGVVWNLAEIGGNGAPFVAGDFVEGRFVLMNDAGEMVFTVEGSRAPFLVQITKDGGSIGTASTASSWTYTVKTRDGSTTLDTGVALYEARPYGKINYAADGSYGLAVYVGGTLILLQAYKESTATAACEAP